MARRPLSSRLRDVADRLDFIGDDGDREAVLEAVKLAEEAERGAAEAAQTALDVDAGFSLNGHVPDADGTVPACPVCGNVVRNTCYHEGDDVAAQRMPIEAARDLWVREHGD